MACSSAAKTNPTITVSRAELTSYKPISDELTLLQLQGVLNPGSSGGPVVDAQGKLCGVQVAIIRGSGLGFAIPTDQVVRMVQGRLSTWRVAVKKNDSGQYDVEYRVQLIDPMKKINHLDLHYVAGDRPHPFGRRIQGFSHAARRLEVDRLETRRPMGRGQFQDGYLRAGPPGRDGAAQLDRWLEEEAIRPADGGANQPGQGNSRGTRRRAHVLRYVDKKKGEGWFIRTATGWDEEDDGATHHFAEVKRDPDMVEVYDAGRKLRVHLHHDKLAFLLGKSKKWVILYSGGWEATGTVIAPK